MKKSNIQSAILVLLIGLVVNESVAQYFYLEETDNADFAGDILESQDGSIYFLNLTMNPRTGINNASKLVQLSAEGENLGSWTITSNVDLWHRGLAIFDMEDDMATVLVHEKLDTCSTILKLNRIDLSTGEIQTLDENSFCDFHIEKLKHRRNDLMGIVADGYGFVDGNVQGYVCSFESDGRLDSLMIDFGRGIGPSQTIALTDSGLVVGDGALYDFYNSRYIDYDQTLIYDNPGYLGFHQHRMYYPGNRFIELLSDDDYKVRIANRFGRTIRSNTFDALLKNNIHYVPWYQGLDYLHPNIIFAIGGYNLENGNGLLESDSANVFSLVRLDSNLNIINHHVVSVPSTFFSPRKVVALHDGGCVMHGVKYTAGQDRPVDLYLMRFDSIGQFITTSTTLPEVEVRSVQVFPNPGGCQMSVRVDGSVEDYVIELYTSDGRQVLRQQLETGSNTINTDGLLQGSYVYRLSNESGRQLASGIWIKG